MELEISDTELLEKQDFIEYIIGELAGDTAREVGFDRDEITIEKLNYTIEE